MREPDACQPVLLERLAERGRVVGLDPRHDLGHVGIAVDLAGCGSPRLMLLGQLLLPERQDRVGVETVEGAEFDHPIVKLAADAGSVDAGSERAFSQVVQRSTSTAAADTACSSRRPSAGPRTPCPAATNSSNRVGSWPADSISMRCQRRTCGPSER